MQLGGLWHAAGRCLLHLAGQRSLQAKSTAGLLRPLEASHASCVVKTCKAKDKPDFVHSPGGTDALAMNERIPMCGRQLANQRVDCCCFACK